MSTVAQAPRMSLDEWATLPEGETGELVDGFLEDEEMPSFVHETVVGWLTHVLRVWALAHGARVFGSGGKFGVGPRSGRLPDATVFLAGARRPPARGLARVAPSIAIEVVSPSPRDERRDRVEKLREYAAFGVRWYWLVDPELRIFEILELDDTGHYRVIVNVSEAVVSGVPGCDGLELDIDALWREVDEVIAEGGEPES